jgi:hypothetical protein
MKKELIDELWNQATRKTLQNGTLNERYYFAKLVAKHERDACAKVCKSAIVRFGETAVNWYEFGDKCAEAIRARRFQ